MIETLTIRRPDDWHLHLRDGAMMRAILPETTRHFARALVMPNLIPPVLTARDAAAYRDRILEACPKDADFTPLMTLYLTGATDPHDVLEAHAAGLIAALKLYPAGATTNSDQGVTDIKHVMPVLEKMAQARVPLCVHGEVTDPGVDIFDREAIFIERVLDPLRRALPDLRIVLEHVTTREGVDYVRQGGANLGATITAHHLIINRNALFSGGIRPHFYCLPIAKREHHRQALLKAATSGDAHFFLGTDSAPHVIGKKENACGCAGIFTATNALACLAHLFEEAGALKSLEGFTSLNGAAFYGLEPNQEKVSLTREKPFDGPAVIETNEGPVVVFDPGFLPHWRVRT